MNNSPCAKLTTSMIPKIRVSPEATSARIMPVTMPLIVWISSWSNGMASSTASNTGSHSHVLADRRVAGPERGRFRRVPHDSLLDQLDARGGLERQLDVLLDQQDRGT